MGVNTEDCSDMNGSQEFKCKCNDRFQGERCEISLCPLDYCRNNGTCTNEINSTVQWICDCPPHFAGTIIFNYKILLKNKTELF